MLGLLRNDTKNTQGTVVIVFGIEIYTSFFTAQLPKDKLEKAIKVTAKILNQKSISFINMQLRIGLFSFFSQAVRLGRVFTRRLWDFINYYPYNSPRTMLKKIPAGVREDLEWWNKLLSIYNEVLLCETRNSQIQTLYINTYLYSFVEFCFEGLEAWEQTYDAQSNAFCAIT